MNRVTEKRSDREHRDFFWVVEVLIFATVAPAIVYGALSLQHIPVA